MSLQAGTQRLNNVVSTFSQRLKSKIDVEMTLSQRYVSDTTFDIKAEINNYRRKTIKVGIKEMASITDMINLMTEKGHSILHSLGQRPYEAVPPGISVQLVNV